MVRYRLFCNRRKVCQVFKTTDTRVIIKERPPPADIEQFNPMIILLCHETLTPFCFTTLKIICGKCKITVEDSERCTTAIVRVVHKYEILKLYNRINFFFGSGQFFFDINLLAVLLLLTSTIIYFIVNRLTTGLALYRITGIRSNWKTQLKEFVSRQCSINVTNLSLSHTRLLNDQTRQFLFPNRHDTCKQMGKVDQIIDCFKLTVSLSNRLL